jgi:phosphopantothenoylcysteine decarboxylase/phosphopantothenate--cysteine ligase
VVHVRSAREMLAACEAALPVDVAVCAAAVADWRAEEAPQKLKKKPGAAPSLVLVENPDILANLSKPGNSRPKLVVGFAAETENLVANATEKLGRKGCDWILANDVSEAAGVFGGENNDIRIIDGNGAEAWGRLSKRDVGEKLARRIASALGRRAAE